MSNSTAEVEADVTEEANKNVCANCGIAGLDNNELEECTACQSVQYCSDKCREEHREQHDEECKNQAVELHDKNLFRQPDSSHLVECPICFLPMPLVAKKSTFWTCCSKLICRGCHYAHDINTSKGVISCPFCREPLVSEEECVRRTIKRVKANNDPAASCFMGMQCRSKGDYDSAFEYFTKAAELGDLEGHYRLGYMYGEGEGVEKDEEKELFHLEKAAIGGHPIARHNLGWYEWEHGSMERAAKHWIIAANLGYDVSMKVLWDMFKDDFVSKQDLEATLRSHQAALDAMKSSDRDAAEADASLDP